MEIRVAFWFEGTIHCIPFDEVEAFQEAHPTAVIVGLAIGTLMERP